MTKLDDDWTTELPKSSGWYWCITQHIDVFGKATLARAVVKVNVSNRGTAWVRLNHHASQMERSRYVKAKGNKEIVAYGERLPLIGIKWDEIRHALAIKNSPYTKA